MLKYADTEKGSVPHGGGALGCRLPHGGWGDAGQRVAKLSAVLLALCCGPISDPRVWPHGVGWLVHT